MELVYFDGECGLCHGFVKFVVRRDTAARFQFAPLHGETFRARLGERASSLPESLIVTTHDDRVLLKSTAAIHVLAHLPGGWPTVAAVMRVFPRGLRDVVYDMIKSVRRRMFARPESACPVMPSAYAARFLP